MHCFIVSNNDVLHEFETGMHHQETLFMPHVSSVVWNVCDGHGKCEEYFNGVLYATLSRNTNKCTSLTVWEQVAIEQKMY